jgi:hypothetical protein
MSFSSEAKVSGVKRVKGVWNKNEQPSFSEDVDKGM